MIDQANKLRDLVRLSRELDNLETALPTLDTPKNAESVSGLETARVAVMPRARVITVTSGKGGVGKTNFTINLAVYMAKAGKRVVIIDADFGLANIDVLFGVATEYSFADVLMGGKTITEALTEGPFGIKFISGGSGIGDLANITEKQMTYLLRNFSQLDVIADVVLIDTGAGISKSVINFVKASKEAIIITTPEPTSITDAYAIIKTVKEDEAFFPEFKIVVNRVEDAKEGVEIFSKINMVTDRFLRITLTNLGSIPNDQNLAKAVRRQQPVSTCYPHSASSRAIENMCLTLLSGGGPRKAKSEGGFMAFVKRMTNDFA